MYDDVTTSMKAQLEAHLQGCPECAERVDAWRRTVGMLDRWEVAAAPGRRPAWGPPALVLLRWAAVVVVSAGMGLAGGIWAARRGGAETRPTVHSVGTAMTAVEVQALVEAAVAREREAVGTALRQVQTEQEAGLLGLRRDLETVAATTDEALRQTRRGLLEVAGYRPAVGRGAR